MAWYQRNYFKKMIFFLKLNLILIIINLVFCFFIIFTIKYNTNLNCTYIKKIAEHAIYKINIDGVLVNASCSINKSLIIDNLHILVQQQNCLKFNISKFFCVSSNKLFYFDKKSLLSHPNISFLVNDNISLTQHFTHDGLIKNFNFFSDLDLIGLKKPQFLFNGVNIIDLRENSNLIQVNLNKNGLIFNNLNFDNSIEIYKKELSHNVKVQSFVYENKNNLNNSVVKVLKN